MSQRRLKPATLKRSYTMDERSFQSFHERTEAPSGNWSHKLGIVARLITSLAGVYFLYNSVGTDMVGAPELTPDQLSNLTFAQNPFFSEGAVFTPEAVVNLSRIFIGREYGPHEILRLPDTISDFFIIENGSCISVRHADEPANVHLRGYQRRGDTIGGLNMLYGKPSMHAVRANEDGVFVWQTTNQQLRELLKENILLAAVMESKFLQTFVEKRDKKPLLLFPGFASVQLIAWKKKPCAGISTIEIGERVWINLEKVLHHNFFQEQCWLRCMALDIVDQTDPIDCKLRAEQGLAAVNALTDGMLAGFTTIFGTLVNDMAQHFGYDSSSVLALPYDWRLAPKKLEERDALFSKMKKSIEHIVAHNKNPGIAICHSMGCNVFNYFIKYIKHELPDTHQEWIDKHIWMSTQIAAPLIGATQAVKAVLIGLGFGLPIEPEDAREMGKTFSSGHWLMPKNVSVPEGMDERIAKPSQWYEDLFTVELESGEVIKYSYDDMRTGKVYRELSDILNDADLTKIDKALQRYFHEDTIYDPLSSPGVPRPPVKRILSLYGTNVPTEVGYKVAAVPEKDSHGRPTGRSSITLRSEVLETSGGILTERDTSNLISLTKVVGQSKYNKSGDGTVPYASLAWANTWHFDDVTVTEVPATVRLDIDAVLGSLGEEVTSMVQSLNTLEPAYTKYESSRVDENGEKSVVTVIELDAVSHRDAIKDLFLFKMFKDEFLWQVRSEFFSERSWGEGDGFGGESGRGSNVEERGEEHLPMEGLWGLLSKFSSRHFRDITAESIFARLNGTKKVAVDEEKETVVGEEESSEAVVAAVVEEDKERLVIVEHEEEVEEKVKEEIE